MAVICRLEFFCNFTVPDNGTEGDTNVVYLHANDTVQAWNIGTALKPDNWDLWSCTEVKEKPKGVNNKGFTTSPDGVAHRRAYSEDDGPYGFI